MAKAKIKNWKMTAKGIRYFFETQDGYLSIVISPFIFANVAKVLDDNGKIMAGIVGEKYGKSKPISEVNFRKIKNGIGVLRKVAPNGKFEFIPTPQVAIKKKLKKKSKKKTGKTTRGSRTLHLKGK